MLIRRKAALKRRERKLLNRRAESMQTVSHMLYANAPWYWRYIAGDSEICYVCDRMIAKKRKVYIGKHPFNGARIYRHFNCHPLTARWQRKFGPRDYFYGRIKRWKERRDAQADTFEPLLSSIQPTMEERPRIVKRRNDTDTADTGKKLLAKRSGAKLIKRRQAHR